MGMGETLALSATRSSDRVTPMPRASGGKVGSNKIVANLGDVDFVGEGGTLVFANDEAEHYSPEEGAAWRYPLERFKTYGSFLVPEGYDETWPHPAQTYRPWFEGSIRDMSESFDVPEDELIAMLTDESPVERAIAYDIIGGYHGFGNLDTDPLELSPREAKKRYKNVK
jgi:hypothetical protein